MQSSHHEALESDCCESGFLSNLSCASSCENNAQCKECKQSEPKEWAAITGLRYAGSAGDIYLELELGNALSELCKKDIVAVSQCAQVPMAQSDNSRARRYGVV